jgi:hypothetical protein
MRGLKTISDCALRGEALDEVHARRKAERMVMKNIMMIADEF